VSLLEVDDSHGNLGLSLHLAIATAMRLQQQCDSLAKSQQLLKVAEVGFSQR